MKLFKISRKQKQHGAAVIEAAIIMPVLIALTFGAIKYGYLYYRMQQATNVVRQAARLGIRPWTTNGDVEARIDTLMTQAGMALADVGYTKNVNCETLPGNDVTVSITLPTSSRKIDILQFNGLTPLFPNPRDLDVSVTMSKEGKVPPPS